ncbi:MAG TPA: NAD-dependent epimerase/dehydratase family protein [Candidatus Solibacter sp.]|nr:NAD-dependent epimerase/dehydratase family protein [Candidatus Solibacter sp.]
MKVILFGATGMVGQGVLRECLLDPEVESVLSVGRTATGQRHARLHELVHKDLTDLSAISAQLSGYDACFFCLGVSSVGMMEQDYRRITYDLTLSVARTLAAQSPNMTFVYVSGTGTDSSERGRSMWARVKGETENALLGLPFQAAYMFRPGYIQPLHGVVPKTRWVRLVYAIVGPLYPVLKAIFPKDVTTTEQIGRAMLRVSRQGYLKRVLESRDINSL